jgi:GNAT superfamily N-acetyltransferase
MLIWFLDLSCKTKLNISIIPYEAKYRDDMLFCYLAAKDAIGAYAPEQWSKPTLKDDLLDIEKHYFERGDIFYLAIDERDRVVGMVGTQTVSPTDLWLKRLFIKAELKGKGVGSRLLAAVEEYAKNKGIVNMHTRFAHWYKEAAMFYPAKGFIEADSDAEYLRRMIKRLI